MIVNQLAKIRIMFKRI